MRRRLPLAVLLCIVLVTLATTASAQTGPTVRVTRHALIMNAPRGDGALLGRVDTGAILEVVGQNGQWLQVLEPATAAPLTWKRGWIHSSAVTLASGTLNFAQATAAPKPEGRLMVRAFGEVGLSHFQAKDSFQTLFGSPRGTSYGGGAQIVLANGTLFQFSADRFRKTGTRALVSGTQVFRLSTPDTVTMTPIQATIGYRDATSNRLAMYVGAGGGWVMFKEDSPTPGASVNKGHGEAHALGAVEYKVAPGVWIAAEVQWRTVPKGLSESGVGAAYQETNLGATTLLFKVFVGH